MNNKIKNISLSGLILFMLFLGGCYYDEVVPEGAIPSEDGISFSEDIMPIFNASCNFAGCHDLGGPPPDLTPGNAYDILIANGYINTNDPASSVLYRWMNGSENTPMPVSGVDPAINAKILAWINEGALNN